MIAPVPTTSSSGNDKPSEALESAVRASIFAQLRRWNPGLFSAATFSEDTYHIEFQLPSTTFIDPYDSPKNKKRMTDALNEATPSRFAIRIKLEPGDTLGDLTDEFDNVAGSLYEAFRQKVGAKITFHREYPDDPYLATVYGAKSWGDMITFLNAVLDPDLKIDPQLHSQQRGGRG